jgi:hypothetical protein
MTWQYAVILFLVVLIAWNLYVVIFKKEKQ